MVDENHDLCCVFFQILPNLPVSPHLELLDYLTMDLDDPTITAKSQQFTLLQRVKKEGLKENIGAKEFAHGFERQVPQP